MNCQEVMELMQRELDHDLSTQEKELMLSHLENCSECAEIFERLKLLSDELTKLPKVVPSHSLVDAILPKLNEIDVQAAASRRESNVPIASVPVQSSVTPPRMLPRTQRSGKHISWKLAGGIVAAGLAIGMFIYGGDRSVSDNADEMLQPQQMSDSKSGARVPAAAGSAANDAIKNQSGPVNGGNNAITEGDAPKETAKPAADPEPSANAAKRTSEPGPVSKPLESASPKPAASSDSSGLQEGVTGTKEPQAPTSTSKPSDKPKSSTGASPSTAPSPAATPAQTETPPVAKSVEPQPTVTKPSDSPKDGTADKYLKGRDLEKSDTSYSVMAVPSKDSDDGEYTAVVEDQKVVVRKKSSSKEIVIASERSWEKSDIISLTGWNKDNQLTYQVTSGNQTHTYVLDPAAKTETIYSP